MKIIICIIFLIIGIVLGVIINDIPYISLKHEATMGDMGSFVLSLLLAIALPLVLHTWIDNQRHLKNFLMDEIKISILSIEQIKNKINDCYSKGKTTKSDKKDIQLFFRESDNKIHCLIEQLNTSFPKKCGQLTTNIFKENTTYWKSVTDGPLMNNNYNIDERFYKDHLIAHGKYEAFLKKSIHTINSF